MGFQIIIMALLCYGTGAITGLALSPDVMEWREGRRQKRRRRPRHPGSPMLLGVEAHDHFYTTNEKARAFLQSVIDNAEAQR